MKTGTFTGPEKKMDLLIRVAKEMGIEVKPFRELTDEEIGLPGPKVSKEQLEDWLAKDDGEGYEINAAFEKMKANLAKRESGYSSAEMKQRIKKRTRKNAD
jgi:hypothetical protein